MIKSETVNSKSMPKRRWLVTSVAFLITIAATVLVSFDYVVPKFVKEGISRITSNQASYDPLRGFWMPYCPFFPNRPDLDGLIIETRQRFFSVVGDSLNHSTSLIVHTGERFTIDEADMDLPGWRQTANSFYLLGHFNISDAIILISPSCESDSSASPEKEFCIQVFVPELTQRQSIFSGSVPNYKRLAKELNIHKVASIRELPFAVPHSHTLWFASPSTSVNSALGNDVLRALRQRNVRMVDSLRAESWFHQARFIKTPKEFLLLQYAGRVSAWAHTQLERVISSPLPDGLVTESFLSIFFQHTCTLCGATLQAYNPIVGAGAHGAVLHFPTGETPDQGLSPVSSPSLVLVDAGASYYHYTSDLTRTYLRISNRAASVPKPMSLIHDIVSRVQASGIEAFVVGNKWTDVVRATQETMTRLLLEHEFLVGHYNDLLERGVTFVFMPHGLGHPVGLDVHDPVPAYWDDNNAQDYNSMKWNKRNLVSLNVPAIIQAAEQEIRHFFNKKITKTHVPPLTHSNSPAYRGSSSSFLAAMDFDIVSGVVQTIEPGVYFIPFLLDSIRHGDDQDELKQFINWTTIDNGKYLDLGGVRIEDTFGIDDNGKRIRFTMV